MLTSDMVILPQVLLSFVRADMEDSQKQVGVLLVLKLIQRYQNIDFTARVLHLTCSRLSCRAK
jgi:hypothetical protein